MGLSYQIMDRPTCPDPSPRFGADGSDATFGAFMAYARQLEAIFLIIHQFNDQ
jgi:hypothetical protein